MDTNLSPADILTRSVGLAARFHYRQLDKQNVPYILHPLAVMQDLLSLYNDYELGAAGVLHDCLEDTPMNTDDMATAGCSNRVIKIVVGVTRLHTESYREFIDRVGNDYDQTRVKLADLRHNMRRSSGNPELESLRKRYQRAMDELSRREDAMATNVNRLLLRANHHRIE